MLFGATRNTQYGTRFNVCRIAAWLAMGFWSGALSAPAIVPWTLLINTNNVVNVVSCGAVGDGVTTNTTAIQNAINAAAAGGTVHGVSGGTVEFRPGIYLSGPLTMKSSVNLQLNAGAILRMLPYDKYPGGITSPPNFISGSGLHDIEISGHGAIDGQGAPWWPGYKTNSRPNVINFSKSSVVLLRDFTVSNSPSQNIVVKGNNAGNVTFRGIGVFAPPSSGVSQRSHNTDAIDFAETNGLIQDCHLDTGDDNIAFGSSGGLTRDVLVTNCFFGAGHGCSIGSHTSSGVSNITVINCTFDGTDNGIRIKSDDGRGGLVQNISYCNLGMTNVGFPIQIYAYYTLIGTPSSISPSYAATQPVAAVSSTTPAYRDITFSNINATSVNGRPIGIIWARTEMPATNIVFNRVNITGDRSFDLYNVKGAWFIDCNLKPSSSATTFALFNSQAVFTNSAPANRLFTFDGLTINGYGSSLAFYNAQGSLKNTNAVDNGPLTLAASTFTVSNNLTLFPTTVLNFSLGSTPATLAVKGNLALGGVINITARAGFTSGIYTLMTYTGRLSGSLPTLGSVPAGYTYSFDTNKVGQVKLVVAATNHVSLVPTNLVYQIAGNQLRLSWPRDHTGWTLQIQTNALSNGLGTNWVDVPDSTATNRVFIPMNRLNGSVFVRLVYL